MKTIVTLLVATCLLFEHGLIAQSPETKPPLKVTLTTPNSPAVIGLGQKLIVNVDYNNPGPDVVMIFVRPFTKGAKTNGYAAHPSKVYQAGEGKTEGYFFFEAAAAVDEVRVTMVDAKTKKEINVLKVPVDLTWK